MVQKALDDYFDQINGIYEKRGLLWYLVEGHYWIELRINHQVRETLRPRKSQVPVTTSPDMKLL